MRWINFIITSTNLCLYTPFSESITLGTATISKSYVIPKWRERDNNHEMFHTISEHRIFKLVIVAQQAASVQHELVLKY